MSSNDYYYGTTASSSTTADPYYNQTFLPNVSPSASSLDSGYCGPASVQSSIGQLKNILIIYFNDFIFKQGGQQIKILYYILLQILHNLDILSLHGRLHLSINNNSSSLNLIKIIICIPNVPRPLLPTTTILLIIMVSKMAAILMAHTCWGKTITVVVLLVVIYMTKTFHTLQTKF